jgi:enoyl-CoA hydratase/carnithine racemase
MRAKSLLSGATSNSFDEQLEAEADNLAQALGGAEAKEGITAFIERRPPTFPEE